jgi:hypothetical protein
MLPHTLPRWLRILVAVVAIYTAVSFNTGSLLSRRPARSALASGARAAVAAGRGAAAAAAAALGPPAAPSAGSALGSSSILGSAPSPAREAALALTWSCPFPRKRISCRMRERVIDQLRARAVRVCLWDGNSHMHSDRISSEMPSPPELYSWDRKCDIERPDSLFGMGSYWPGWFIEQLTAFPGEDSYKVLLCTEPPVVQPEMYAKVRELKAGYDLTLSLADSSWVNDTDGGNVLQWSFGSSHVPLEHWAVYPKTRLCSIIASKQDWAPGHKMRHAAIAMIQRLGFDCTPLGKGYSFLPAKADGLRDYMFSIVIENSISGRYMTEKIIDAVATGTVPVYWGSSWAKELFGEGILTFDTLEQLEALLPSLTPQLYAAMLPQAVANVDKARGYVPPERWLWHNVFECAYRWHAANGDCRTDEEIRKEYNELWGIKEE